MTEFAETIRAAIRASGASALKLAKETGVSQPTITEFLRGKDVRLGTANKLAERFGLVLRQKPKRGKK
jgi:transcriptional regulator with XRE-family HTH domain